MIPVSDAPPPGVIDRRDGNTKGECGITTTACLFCKDQIAGSADYVENYEQVKWASKDACQMATCPHWNTPCCRIPIKDECPVYLRWKTTGRWEPSTT